MRILLWIMLFLALIRGSFWFRYYGLAITPFRIAMPFFIILLILCRKKVSFGVRWVRGFYIFFAVWMVYASLQLVYSSNHLAGIKKTLLLSSGIFLSYCICAILSNMRDLRKFILVMGLFCLFVTTIGFWEHLTSKHLLMSTYSDRAAYTGKVALQGRLTGIARDIPSGTQYNPNDFAMALALLAVFTVGAWQVKLSYAWRYTGLVVVVGTLAVIIWTGSRTCMVTMMIGIASLFLASKGSRGKFKIGLVIAVLALIVWVGSVFFTTTAGTGEKFIEELQSLRNWRKNPRLLLLGNASYTAIVTYGLGTGPANAADHMARGPFPVGHLTDPHSLPGELLSEFGIFIFLGMVIVFVKILKELWRIRQHDPDNEMQNIATLAIVSIIVLLFATITPSTSMKIYEFWFVIGFGLATIKIGRLRKTMLEEDRHCFEYEC